MKRITKTQAISLVLLLLLLTGTATGVYLTQQKTSFEPKASEEPRALPAQEAKRVSYELHGIIFPQFSTSIKKKLFEESANTGKKINRFDIAFSTVVINGPTVPSTDPSLYTHNWVLADENIRLAFKNGVEPLVILGESKKFIGKNPDTCDESQRCFKDPPAKNRYADYIREYVKAVADRYSGNTDDPQNPGQKLPKVSFYEFWNEPMQDFGRANGTPEEYAELSILVYDAIKKTNPAVVVTTGGFSNQTFDDNEIGWVRTVMNKDINGVKAKDKFDVANFHINVPITRDPNDPSQANKGTVKSKVKAARQFFDDIGRADAPLWITEHGWPTIAQMQKRDIKYNADNPLFKNIPCPSPNPFSVCPTPAEYAQAAYYKESLPILLGQDGSERYRAATKVFVTLRDRPSNDDKCDGDTSNGEDEFCSNGILRFGRSNDPASITRKPSFCVFSKMQPGQTPPSGYNCPSSTPTPSPVVTPTSTPTPTSSLSPSPTPVPTLTPSPTPLQTPTPRITPTPTLTPGGARLAFNLHLQGIGSLTSGENPSPLHPQRPLTTRVFDTNNNQVGSDRTGTITFSSAGQFTGIIDLGTTFAQGSYTLTVNTQRYLRKLIPGIQTITSGTINTMPQVTLTVGDISGDNVLDIQDFNLLFACFGEKANAPSCTVKEAADLTDDGKVDGIDYNLLLRNLASKTGD